MAGIFSSAVLDQPETQQAEPKKQGFFSSAMGEPAAPVAPNQPSAAPMGSARGQRMFPGGKLTTPAQVEAMKDLQRMLESSKSALADTVPGTVTHQRISRDIVEMEAALGQAPKRPAAAQQPQAPASQVAAPQAASIEQPSTIQKVANVGQGVKGILAKMFPQTYGMGEAVATVGGGMLASIPAGLYGLAKSVLPGEEGTGAEAVRKVQQALTYEPTTPEGKRNVEAVSGFMHALGVPGQKTGEWLGQKGAHPATSTAAELVVNPLNLLPLAKTLKGGSAEAKAAAAGAEVGAAEGQAIPRPGTPEFAAWSEAQRRAAEIRTMTPQTLTEAQPARPPAAAPTTSQATPLPTPLPTPGQSTLQSAGAAAANNATRLESAAAGELSAQHQARLAAVDPAKLETRALRNHEDARQLPVPIDLTRGQATEDIRFISDEWNKRNLDNGAIALRLKDQNDKLLQNINAIRDKAAPDVYATSHIENAQSIIDRYKDLDAGRRQEISGLYKQLEDANGGAFPVDAQTFVKSADAALAKKLKSDFVPAPIARQLSRLREGEPLNFEQFEALRTNLAAEIRKAERTGDGNAAVASSIVRDALESLPMTGEAASRLKPLADQARSAAKNRFSMLEKDPAYKAAVNDSVAPDNFVQKFIINGKKGELQEMLSQFGPGSDAHQAMSAATINWLRSKAGLVGEAEGNFNQAGYNKGLQQISHKLDELMPGETAQQLKTLGRVAQLTQQRRVGSFVATSATPIGLAAQMTAQGLKGAISQVPIVGRAIPAIEKLQQASKERKLLSETLEPYAGIEKPKTKLRDISNE